MAGGPITVTDRISVRVSAKTQEQSAANKKAVGGAIGKTLGNEDISDELKTQLGNTKNPVVYDEDGNAWISMEDIIAAGKKMNENGAFATEEIHHGLVDSDGTVYNLDKVYGTEHSALLENGNTITMHSTIGSPLLYYTWHYCFFSTEDFQTWQSIQYATGGGSGMAVDGDPVSATINGITYTWFRDTSGVINGSSGPFGIENVSKIDGSWPDEIKSEAGYLFGPVTPAGNNPLIDWTKTDEEIARDIQELHDTWDVSEHEGAVTANGTYVLAGPIEFNPGD